MKKELKDFNYNPEKNPNAMSIIKQEDGNWIGKWQKNGKIVEARQADPQIVVQLLLTHE